MTKIARATYNLRSKGRGTTTTQGEFSPTLPDTNEGHSVSDSELYYRTPEKSRRTYSEAVKAGDATVEQQDTQGVTQPLRKDMSPVAIISPKF